MLQEVKQLLRGAHQNLNTCKHKVYTGIRSVWMCVFLRNPSVSLNFSFSANANGAFCHFLGLRLGGQILATGWAIWTTGWHVRGGPALCCITDVTKPREIFHLSTYLSYENVKLPDCLEVPSIPSWNDNPTLRWVAMCGELFPKLVWCDKTILFWHKGKKIVLSIFITLQVMFFFWGGTAICCSLWRWELSRRVSCWRQKNWFAALWSHFL